MRKECTGRVSHQPGRGPWCPRTNHNHHSYNRRSCRWFPAPAHACRRCLKHDTWIQQKVNGRWENKTIMDGSKRTSRLTAVNCRAGICTREVIVAARHLQLLEPICAFAISSGIRRYLSGGFHTQVRLGIYCRGISTFAVFSVGDTYVFIACQILARHPTIEWVAVFCCSPSDTPACSVCIIGSNPCFGSDGPA